MLGRLRKIKAQSILEYAAVITLVVAAFAAMHFYVQRAVMANIKIIEETMEHGDIQ